MVRAPHGYNGGQKRAADQAEVTAGAVAGGWGGRAAQPRCAGWQVEQCAARERPGRSAACLVAAHSLNSEVTGWKTGWQVCWAALPQKMICAAFTFFSTCKEGRENRAVVAPVAEATQQGRQRQLVTRAAAWHACHLEQPHDAQQPSSVAPRPAPLRMTLQTPWPRRPRARTP